MIRTPWVDVPNCKRMALVGISLSELARLMHLPEGMTSTAATFDERTQEVVVRIEGDELPEVREGHALPKLNVWLKRTAAMSLEDGKRIDAIEFDRLC